MLKHTTTFCFILFFLSKVALAQDLSWVKHMGGVDSERANASFVDDHGNIYMVGQFYGTVDFDPGTGVSNLTSAGANDVFVTKLDTNGDLIWAVNMGGDIVNIGDFGLDIIVDDSGYVYTTGYFEDTADFDPGPNTFHLISRGTFEDMFVSKLDSNGNFVWAKSIGSEQNVQGKSLALDNTGNVYLTGYFTDTTDFDPSASTYELGSSGSQDAFVLKLNRAGDFVWANKIGSTGIDHGMTIKYDDDKNLYLAGLFEGTVDFDFSANTYNLTSNSSYDIFVLKIDTAGNFVWAESFGGTQFESVLDLELNASGHLYLGGMFMGTVDFDPGASTSNFTALLATIDGYITKFDTAGNFVWAGHLITNGNGEVSSIAIDSSDNVYLSGRYTGTVGLAGTSLNYNSAGAQDVFVYKLDNQENLLWGASFGGTQEDFSNDIVVDFEEYILVSGFFTNTVDFDPGSGTHNLTANGAADIFLSRLYPCSHSTDTQTVVSCNQYISPSGKYNWTISGTYQDTLLNANVSGCDSIITINLTINYDSHDTLSLSSCGTYVSPSGKYNWTTSGVYNDTIATSNGCDSNLVINLSIENNTFDTISVNSCLDYTSPSGNYQWTSSGRFQDTIQNLAGCDSILTIDLTIDDYVYQTIMDTVCHAYTSPSGRFVWTTSGVYQDTVSRPNTCDSVLTVDLVINERTYHTLNVSSCNNYSSPSGRYTWSNSGVYKDTISNALGCDSVITVNLDIKSVDTSVTKSGSMLTANANNAQFQWVDCDDNFSPINGETQSVFTPQENGNYAVIVIQNACVAMSSCYLIDAVGLNENSIADQFKLYPNPAKNTITLESSVVEEIKLFTSNGELLLEQAVDRKISTIDIREVPAGVYYIQLGNKESHLMEKLIITK